VAWKFPAKLATMQQQKTRFDVEVPAYNQLCASG
jgi:hypothetical protein